MLNQFREWGKVCLFVSLLEGAGDVYLFWPPKLGCGHHFFLPTSKYMKGRGSRRGAGTPENITFISYAIVYRYYSFHFKENNNRTQIMNNYELNCSNILHIRKKFSRFEHQRSSLWK